MTPRRGDAKTRRARRRGFDARDIGTCVVVGIAALGLLDVGVLPAHWLRGVLLLAGALGLAGLLRLVLPDRLAGLLAIRGRLFDAGWFIAFGAAMVILGMWLRSIGAT